MDCQLSCFDPGFRSTGNFFSFGSVIIKLKLTDDMHTLFCVLIIDNNGITTITMLLLFDKRSILSLHRTSSQALSTIASLMNDFQYPVTGIAKCHCYPKVTISMLRFAEQFQRAISEVTKSHPKGDDEI